MLPEEVVEADTLTIYKKHPDKFFSHQCTEGYGPNADKYRLLCFADPVTDVKENPDHNLGSSYKTFIKRGTKGLGLVLIENGSFLQILRVIESGPGDSESNLKPGDILVKIGNTNVLGHKLRELRQLVGKIPIGTQLQVVVYRNYKEIPDNWKSEAGADRTGNDIEQS
ncbi:PDZ domain-containing protein 9-like [Hemitrygon akajei]|uniref:PDZ domain-containing protein 9-like n=1 Tax=Hemitrygon akajei TaxID=2704970 RepID=UPI003BFA19C8